MSDPSNNAKLTHVDAAGRARMVDVGGKPSTERQATAVGFVRCNAALLEAIRLNNVAKGDVLQVAQLAGVMAAKRTDQLIPLCHSLPLDHVVVEAALGDGGITLRATARTTARTGVEMEAFTAVTVAALTVIDMGKAIDKAMVIEGVRLIEKTGGKSGDYHARPPEVPQGVAGAGALNRKRMASKQSETKELPRGVSGKLPGVPGVPGAGGRG